MMGMQCTRNIPYTLTRYANHKHLQCCPQSSTPEAYYRVTRDAAISALDFMPEPQQLPLECTPPQHEVLHRQRQTATVEKAPTLAPIGHLQYNVLRQLSIKRVVLRQPSQQQLAERPQRRHGILHLVPHGTVALNR